MHNRKRKVTRIALYDYIPRKDTEIVLRAGDVIQFESIRSDGWGKVYNLSTSQSGIANIKYTKII
jgi:hypothetical protein